MWHAVCGMRCVVRGMLCCACVVWYVACCVVCVVWYMVCCVACVVWYVVLLQGWIYVSAQVASWMGLPSE